jgi:hypothetical protein
MAEFLITTRKEAQKKRPHDRNFSNNELKEYRAINFLFHQLEMRRNVFQHPKIFLTQYLKGFRSLAVL